MENKQNFTMGGKLGDFIHTLFALKNICEKRGTTANLYIYDIGWEHGIDAAYSELLPIIKRQPYINSFEILKNYDYINGLKFHDQAFATENIDLGEYIKSSNLYKMCWSNIFETDYNFKSIDSNWITFPDVDVRFSNKVVINRRNNIYRINEKFPYKQIMNEYSGDIIFIASSEDDYTAFPYKSECDFYKINSISDWFTTINSSELYIGNLSAPTSIASAIDKKRIIELPNTMDSVHWIGEEKYSSNISWFLNDYNLFNFT